MDSILDIIYCINRKSSRKIIVLLEKLQREDISEEERSRLRDLVAEEYKIIGYNDSFLKNCPLKKRKEGGDSYIKPIFKYSDQKDDTLPDDSIQDNTFPNSSRKRKEITSYDETIIVEETIF
jgi:hypothetical protein